MELLIYTTFDACGFSLIVHPLETQPHIWLASCYTHSSSSNINKQKNQTYCAPKVLCGNIVIFVIYKAIFMALPIYILQPKFKVRNPNFHSYS